MKRALVGVTLVTGLAACIDFDAELRARIDAGFADVDGGTVADGGATTDSGASADGGPNGNDGGPGLDGGGCIGDDGWCWQYPFPIANELVAAWGTTDRDVWVAGAGRTLLHFDGTNWVDGARALGLPPSSTLNTDEEFTVVGSALGPANERWLFGRGLPPQIVVGGRCTAATGAAAKFDSVINVSRGERAIYLAMGSSGVGVVPLDGGTPVTVLPPTWASWFILNAVETPNGCLAAMTDTATGDTVAVGPCDGGTVTTLPGVNRVYGLFTNTDGGWVATSVSSVFESGDEVTWLQRAVPVNDQAVTGGLAVRSTHEMLVTGQLGWVWSLTKERFDRPTTNPQIQLRTLWESDEGSVWAVGDLGNVAVRTGTSNPTWESRALVRSHLFAVADTETDFIAVGDGRSVMVRNAAGALEAVRNDSLNTVFDVALVGKTAYLAQADGLSKLSLQTPGLAPTALYPTSRTCTTVTVRGGAVYAGCENEGVVVFDTGDGGLSHLSTVGLGLDDGGLVLGPRATARDWYLAVLRLNDSTLYTQPLDQPDAGWAAVQAWPNAMVTSLSTNATEVWVAGDHAILAHGDKTGLASVAGLAGGDQFSSVAVLPDGGAYASTYSGIVLHWRGADWARERPHLGGATGTNPEPAIRVTPGGLYLVGNGNAVIRKAAP